MSVLIPIRPGDTFRAPLEADVRDRGIGLATLLRQRAADATRGARRTGTRAQSAVVARHIAGNPGTRAFYEDWRPLRPTSHRTNWTVSAGRSGCRPAWNDAAFFRASESETRMVGALPTIARGSPAAADSRDFL